MSEISPEVVSMRQLRRRILEILKRLFDGCPDMPMTFDELTGAILKGLTSWNWSKEQIVSEAYELRSRGLVGIDGAPKRMIRSTAKGRDFLLAGCPWEEIDEFTGDQSLGG